MYEDKYVSTRDIQLFCMLLWEKAREAERSLGDKEHPDVVNFDEASDKVLKVFMCRFLVDCYRYITQLSNPDHKYYSIYVDIAPLCKKTRRWK